MPQHSRRKLITHIDDKSDDNVIRELVEAEQKASLARFRSSHFQERLEQRIRSSSLQPHRTSVFRVIPRPVWVSLAALLTYRFLAAPKPKAGEIVENFLRQLPGMQSREKEPRVVSDLSSVQISSL